MEACCQLSWEAEGRGKMGRGGGLGNAQWEFWRRETKIKRRNRVEFEVAQKCVWI